MFASEPRELMVLDEVAHLLAKAQSLDDIKSLRDKSEAARTFIKAARLGLDLQNRAAELRLRAERKAGNLLSSLHLRGGNRRSKRHHAALKLEDLGISRDQSRRWQYVASVSNDEFANYLQDMIGKGREITTVGLLRFARKTQTKPRRQSVISEVSQDGDLRVPDELLMELANHCRLLADVLRPVYEEAAIDLRKAERRIVGRLIGDMSEIIRQLTKTWTASNPD